MTKKEAYAILGLQNGQHAAAIRSAYRKLSKQFHPDINPQGQEDFIRINEAYDLLTQTAQRQESTSYYSQRAQPEMPKASDFPNATEEELFWLLHPHEKSRLAYTAYYNSEHHGDHINYKIIAQGLNFAGYLSFIASLSLAMFPIYGKDFLRAFLAIAGIVGAYLMPNFSLLKQFRWAHFVKHLPDFLIESIIFRFGFLMLNIAWLYYFFTRLLVNDLIYGILLTLLVIVIHYALFFKFLKLPFSGFISIGMACFTFNCLLAMNTFYTFEERYERHAFTIYEEKIVKRATRRHNASLQIVETPVIVLANDAYSEAYLFRFRPWQDKHPTSCIEIKIKTGLLGIDYVDAMDYVESSN